MKALIYHGPGKRSWQDAPDPDLIDPTDAIVRVDAVTICGTDLHILGGDVPETTPGRILGHEAVGTVVETGTAVAGLHVGDRALLSYISDCGRCGYCRIGRYGQCRNGGGWILGHLIDGTQAEYVRVPFADTSTYLLPEQVSDEAALLLADILPTSYEVGVLAGRLSPGQSVAVVGAGPIGLAAISTAKLLSPTLIIAIDKDPARCDAAKTFGADIALEPGAHCVEQIMAGAGPNLSSPLGAGVVSIASKSSIDKVNRQSTRSGPGRSRRCRTGASGSPRPPRSLPESGTGSGPLVPPR